MQAVLIAAGESSRCWPFNHKHKSEIKVLGKPLIYWTLKSISAVGVKDIILVVGENSVLPQTLPLAVVDLGVKLTFVIQKKPLGAGQALTLVEEYIKDDFFVFWPYKVNAGEIIKQMNSIKEAGSIVLTGTTTTTPWDFGILKMAQEQILEIVENPAKGAAPSDLKLTGNYLLSREFFKYYHKLEKHHSEDLVDALNLYLKAKPAKFLFLAEDKVSLKYPWDLFNIQEILFKQNKIQSYIDPSAVIGKGTVLEGAIYIGANCKIGTYNVLRGPLNLEEGVKTGAFCELKGSIIGADTHFHSGYVGNSIVGEACRFGAGFITANRRTDRQNIKATVKGEKVDTGLTYLGTMVGNNTRFGIQSGTMPGVIIGRNCSVGPGTLVFENLEDNFKLYTEFKSIKKKSS